MIIAEYNGDIMKSSMRTLVCPVNCIGVMGKGLAETMKDRIPGLYEAYRAACRSSSCTIGRPWLYKRDFGPNILCFPTKDHFKYPSEIEWIEKGLIYLKENYRSLGIETLALPALGCGKTTGQLNWEFQVRPLIYYYLNPLFLMDTEIVLSGV